MASTETQGVLPGLSQGCGVTDHWASLGQHRAPQTLLHQDQPHGVFEVPSPDEEANKADKQSTGKEKKSHHVPQLQSSEQARGQLEYRKKGEEKGALISGCSE